VQGRGDPGATPRGDGPPPPGGPAEAGLGRPCDPFSPGPAAATRTAGQPTGHPGNPAGLAPPPAYPQVDLPESAWPPVGRAGGSRPGVADGGGEPRLGIPPGARRADPARLPGQGGRWQPGSPGPGLPGPPAQPGALPAAAP